MALCMVPMIAVFSGELLMCQFVSVSCDHVCSPVIVGMPMSLAMRTYFATRWSHSGPSPQRREVPPQMRKGLGVFDFNNLHISVKDASKLVGSPL